jgi:hypothetical protein
MLSGVSPIARIALAVAIVFASHVPAVEAWEFAHGNRDNTGFTNVATAPAAGGSISVPGLGSFFPGVGPVVAPDGTVYVGTRRGKLIALRADGKPFWSREIPSGELIVASPAISSDGSIYVIGVKTTRDPSVKPPKVTMTSTLHRFNNTGAWLGQTPFPAHGEVGPAAFGPPNIWRLGGAEAIMVPAVYTGIAGYSVRLIAFSLGGQVLDEKVVKNITPETVGGSGRSFWQNVSCLSFITILAECLGIEFDPQTAPSRPAPASAPGVGIFTFTGGGTPFILVSDNYKDLVGYTFSGQRLTEAFRVHENAGFLRTPPVILPDGHTLIGVQGSRKGDFGIEEPIGSGRILFAGPNANKIAPVALAKATKNAPTRMADGRVAVVDEAGHVIILKDGKSVTELEGAGPSIASAAASLSHLFVSGEAGFVTYDAHSLNEVARFDWVGGGRHPPAIGPKGHVYAIASNILFVFPPPKLGASIILEPQTNVTISTKPDLGLATAQEKTYAPPLTTSGNRLFACDELDQDDCGKGDHKGISLAWCQKQGYTKVMDYAVDGRKVKAESLDGRFCAKTKCKVFDKIICN